MTRTEPRAKQPAAAGDEYLQYLAFKVAGEAYAVDISDVREIISFRFPTQVPMTPPHVMGVINLRGSVVPLIDLARKFGLPETAISKRTCIIIAEAMFGTDIAVMGMVVDAVSAVIDVDRVDIEDAPRFGLAVSTEYLRGMARIGERFLPVLDLGLVLGGEGAVASRTSAENALTPAVDL